MRKRAALVILAVGLLTVPLWVPNPYHLHVLIMAGIFAILALSLNLLLGYTGQLSLGHTAFFGIGAYTSALLTLRLRGGMSRRAGDQRVPEVRRHTARSSE